jgi:hypothetical protein
VITHLTHFGVMLAQKYLSAFLAPLSLREKGRG